jgi:antitoxin (DNA-binding transcriptional repressor) of toxin-antitoxin stability system
MTAEEAAVHFDALLARVEHGETVEITREGQAIALIQAVPRAPKAFDPDEAQRAAKEWIAYRNEHNITLGGLSIRELIEEGRM